MVYCGKPSKSCDPCRKRRLKCDQKRPGCRQCRNASRPCTGYRNPLDLMFRDESERVQQKCRSPQARDTDTGGKGDSSSLSLPQTDIPVTKARSTGVGALLKQSQQALPCKNKTGVQYPILAQVTQPLSDVATAFFLTQYIPGSHFDYLPLMYSPSSTESPLGTVIKAVSLASLSHETRRPELMTLARQEYSHSLVETNRALQSAEASRQDGTLASVLLLAHFEALASDDSTENWESDSTSSDSNLSSSWNCHVEGAVALLALRPKPQGDSIIHERLTRHVNAITRYSCIQRQIRLPEELLSLESPKKMRQDAVPDDPNPRLMMAVDDFTELRAQIHEGSLTDPVQIIERAQHIEKEIAGVAKVMFASWAYEMVTPEPGCEREDVYDSEYHLYPDHHTAQLWNELRMTRVSLNEVMYHYSGKVETEKEDDGADENDHITIIDWPARRARYAHVIQRMATKICQSTTQFLCKEGLRMTLLDGTPATGTKTTIASAYFLIWPLFSAARASFVVDKPAIRAFAIDRLRFIERQMKIPQAKKVALMLERGVVHEDWLHMLHLF